MDVQKEGLSNSRKWLVSAIVLICMQTVAWAGQNDPAGLSAWLGARGKVAWIQDHGDGADVFGRSRNLMLFGYDSNDNLGERPLLKEKGNYFKPLLTPDGGQVVVSDRLARKMYLVDWRSGRKKELGSGVAVALWRDPKPSFFLRKHTVWVYCFSGRQRENKYGTAQPLYRFPLDDPEERELIWDKTNMAWSNIQLSRDGRLLGGLFPWPDGGVLDLKSRKWTRLGRGCWTSLSPDDSNLLWIFDGQHRNIQVHDLKGGGNWKVNINGAPGIGGFEVYHPRWSNHPRFFALTGPYEKGEGGNRIGGGGEKVEIYLGRFDRTVKTVEGWLQLTNNRRADFYPDLWVEGGDHSTLDSVPETVSKPAKGEATWPAARDHLVFLWQDMKAPNQLGNNSPGGFFQCNLYLRGKALYTADLSLAAGGGWADSGEAGKRIGEQLAQSDSFGLETLVRSGKTASGSIFSFAAGTRTWLQGVQKKEELVLVDSRGQTVSWQKVFSRNFRHLTLNGSGSTVELFVDGQSRGKRKLPLALANNQIDSFYLGERDGSWNGYLSHLAVYTAPRSVETIQANSRILERVLKKSGDSRGARLVLSGRLEESTTIPQPDSLGAYRRALVVNLYTVDKVLQGTYDTDRVLVAEWAVLDRQIVKQYPEKADAERLVLEPFEHHPELEGERQMMDVFEPDLEMYYRLPPNQQ